ncbi:Pimeloyl-ACP methyl ester carboxylesterase [Streptomyces sp. cf386]|uniref:alpha/beta fold hydrolase n=1 Tax=Streptomyces sp. cf386 TaxID=1761904 RepID=UPI000881517E|nr:alpha/beta fold hydrolase [Streptomyces sp. cf386]SDO82493.1 Pimeloyl-ACP methyl ester carboxylesterase [Streptomyces sp. cf386]
MTAYDIAGLHLERAGTDGPLVLCLHGIGSSSAAFAPQLEALGRDFRVLAWDAPGYGKSADPDSALTLDDFADTAAEVIRAHGGRAHVVGVSWGGVIALRLATRHSDLVDSLTVADSTPGSATSPEKAAGMRARVPELAELGPRAFAERRGPRLVSQDAPYELVQRVVDTMAGSIRLPGYGHAAESMATTDLRGELARVTAPTLVLCGDQDRITGPEASQVLAGGLRKTAYVIVKDAGHLANQERPEHFNAWLLSHLHIVTNAKTSKG